MKQDKLSQLKNNVIEILIKNAKRRVVGPSDYNEPYIEMRIMYDDIGPEQWEQIKELFKL